MSFFSKINNFLFTGAKEYPKIGAGKTMVLGLQHAFAIQSATPTSSPVSRGTSMVAQDMANAC